ncbi:MAG: transposase [Candidatus Omnitrophica bacterium]|nr:transposase [Candidatus Omnitrophota bacterium]
MKQLTSLGLTDLWKEVKTEEQTRALATPRHARKVSCLGYRNGFYVKSIESSLGLIENIKVPRNRLANIKFSIFKKYRRKEVALLDLIKDAFLSGLSTRKMGEVLEVVLGYKVSATIVSNIAKSLDAAVEVFHRKAIEDSYKYLFLDGITLKVKTLCGVVKKTVLVACGITKDGVKEIISFRLAPSES